MKRIFTYLILLLSGIGVLLFVLNHNKTKTQDPEDEEV